MGFSSRRARTALTQIELLVVIAIALLSVALLLPATQKMREAAARLRSAERLKRIGAGFHRHEEARGGLPQGGTQPTGAALASPADRDQWSWAYQILPFVGEEALYRADVGTIDATPVDLFHIPSRRPAASVRGLAKIDFAGNAGTGDNGVVVEGDRPRVRRGDIHDGGANTVLVGEKRMNPAMFGRSADDDEPFARAGWGDFEVYRLCLMAPRRDMPRNAAWSPYQGFGSPLASGFNCLFADGSVRHVRYGIDPDVWRRACVRDDSLALVANDP